MASGLTGMALILAINEEKDSLALMARLLIHEGHQVTSFNKVEQALEWLKDHLPDLVLASGGRQGERAAKTINLLTQTGLPAAKILLWLNPGAYVQDPKALPIKEGKVISDTLDQEDLIRLINKSV
jgi:CheY-like chemotaxis protein